MKRKQNNRILLISASPVWSMGNKKGAGSFFRTIEGLSKHYEVDFVCRESCRELPSSVFCHPVNLPTLNKLIQLPVINYFAYPIWWLSYIRKTKKVAIRLILSQRPSVIYAYEIQAVPTAHALSKRFGIPLDTRFQGTKLEFGKMSNIWYRLKMFDHIVALRTPSNLIIMTNDGTQGDKILKRLGNKSRTLFWLNGVEKPIKFSSAHVAQIRNQLGLIHSQKLILMVSRLVGWKRVDRMISILPGLMPQYKLVIAGDGPEKSRLEEMVRQSGKDDAVKFLGAIKQDKIDELFAAADIFISLYDLSNVGNPLLQAMSCGKAIVTLDNGDTRYFIDSSRGFLLPPDKPDKLADSVNKLLKDASLRHKLGTEAKIFADKNFWSWNERINKEIEEVKKLTGY